MENEMQFCQDGMIIEFYAENGEITLVVEDNSIDLNAEILQKMLDMIT